MSTPTPLNPARLHVESHVHDVPVVNIEANVPAVLQPPILPVFLQPMAFPLIPCFASKTARVPISVKPAILATFARVICCDHTTRKFLCGCVHVDDPITFAAVLFHEKLLRDCRRQHVST
jgi:hypothetical protein